MNEYSKLTSPCIVKIDGQKWIVRTTTGPLFENRDEFIERNNDIDVERKIITINGTLPTAEAVVEILDSVELARIYQATNARLKAEHEARQAGMKKRLEIARSKRRRKQKSR